MTIDHVTWLLLPDYPTEVLPIILHIIGRLTCPIMCYFIAEGYYYTKDINKYTSRLFLFSFISHFAYIYASSSYVDWKSFIPFYYGDFFNQTSVMWSLALGLVMLRVIHSKKIKNDFVKIIIIVLICIIGFPADWSCIGSLCVLAFGLNRGKLKQQSLWLIFFVFLYSVIYYIFINKLYGIIQMGVIFAIPILAMYNGKRGKNPKINKIIKWIFYIYYPLHLFVIGIIQQSL